jgi:type II secretory pathway pseudopilin PulG
VKRSINSQAAFSLVEVTLALGIAAFCLIAVLGLVPVGVQTNRNATSQTAATNILSGVVSDIRASPKGFSGSLTAKYKIRRAKGNITTVCFDGQGQPDGPGQIGNRPCRAGNWRYRLYVRIYPTVTLPPNLTPYCANYVVLKLVWPAAADPLSTTITPSGSVEMVTSFFDN